MSIEKRQRHDMCAFYRRVVCAARLVLVGLLSSIAHERAWADAGAGPSIALFYGTQPPVSQLRNFDVAVVEPDSGFEPLKHKNPDTAWFAYVSVGEVEPQRPYYAAIPKAWQLGDNTVWGAKVIDQDAADWPAFYVEHVIAPLWKKGYRGFFLDTLDSYQIVAKTDAARARQERGLVAVVRAIKARYPRARLIFNRGFEILPQVHSLVYAVAFESLYRGWDQAGKRYTEITQADRDWLLAQAKTIREQYRLPVLAIDYCASADSVCAADTVNRISAAGLVPYVTDGGLQTVGVGPARAMRQ
ncbi:endo alpha-1,4 polygalactosaminidase [Paraburkholderia strydomiana]|uniref:endo alpha-1,4 polygalactosaminidase n=1 Tax=Paraburkholderia strydomiana TaxID=1245417 RepID=UPI0038BCBAC7